MKEGIFNRIMGIKTVLKSCFNNLKTIYSPNKIYNPLIIRKTKHCVQLQIPASRVWVLR